MRKITRTVSTTSIKVGEYRNGEVLEISTIVVPGEINDPARIAKIAKRKYPNVPNLITLSTETKTEKRAIDFDTFMELSEVVADAEENEEPHSFD